MKNITEQELSDELLIKINNKEQELPSDINSQLADITTLTGNKDNLKTTNKTNLVSAINEVFTSGNNVKFNTVDALLSLDKNLQISKESTWEDIIKNISKISTGKKWAMGNVIGSKNTSFYPAEQDITITNLSFKPSIVFLGTATTKRWDRFIFLSTVPDFPINKIKCSYSNSVYDDHFSCAIINNGFSVACSVEAGYTPEYKWLAVE